MRITNRSTRTGKSGASLCFCPPVSSNVRHINMLTIAGGIIIALLILAFLPQLLAGAVGLLGIAIAAAIIFAFLLNNFADAVVLLALLVAAGALIFLYSTYAQSRNLRLFGRKLVLLASPALSPRKQEIGRASCRERV